MNDIVGHLRGWWTRSVAKVLCYLGHHDYEALTLHSDYAVLECFYCERQKNSHVVPQVRVNKIKMSLVRATSLINGMRYFKDNWDGEDAPAPSKTAIDQAIAIAQCVVPDEVDIDVMGGVALYFYGDKRLWIHVMNDGSSTLTVM